MIPKFKSLFQNQNFFINGWLSIPNTFTAEAMSKMGWDSLTIDLQHGQSDYSNSIAMLQAMSSSEVFPFVRVPWNEAGIIMSIILYPVGLVASLILFIVCIILHYILL